MKISLAKRRRSLFSRDSQLSFFRNFSTVSIFICVLHIRSLYNGFNVYLCSSYQNRFSTVSIFICILHIRFVLSTKFESDFLIETFDFSERTICVLRVSIVYQNLPYYFQIEFFRITRTHYIEFPICSSC